ncbi:MAG: hypothetical protein QOJ12_2825, partial [Thermoleophilales bacterium]|nr:hypothetical protein [Thermoleophilales bacterium]
VWGLGGMSARRVALRTGKRTTEPRLSPQGGFIEFRPPTVGREDAQATFRYPGGRSQTIYGDGNEREIMASVPHLRPVRGQSQIDARAPDPHGGLPYAVGVVRSRYGWCTMLDTRIVGDAVGRIDFDLGTFATAGVGASACSEPGRGPTRRRPVFAAYTIGGSVPGQGADPERGRVARRTLSGVTTVGGTTAPDVTAITIATPRDVRTLTPSPRAHAFLAVYDGEFPTGEIVITARFSDGTSRVADRFDLGGL